MREYTNFAWPVTVMAQEDYIALEKCIFENKDKMNNKEIIIFGAGIRGSLFDVLLKKWGINKVKFVDNNQQKWGGYINDAPIVAPEYLQGKSEECVVLISIENGDLIKEQLEQMSYKENQSYYYIESNLYQEFVKEFTRNIDTQVLFLGDCGLSQIAIKDKITDNLCTLLKDKLGRENTKVLAMHGMGMRAFYEILRLQIKLGMCPNILGIMVNFEVFTGKHHILPRTQHIGLFKRIAEIFEEEEELSEYIKIIEQRFRQLQLDVFSKPITPRDTLLNSKLIIKQNYMYMLKEDTEDMLFLKKILQLCKEKKIKVLPFIPPANYEFAKQLNGSKFEERYNQNRIKMKEIILKEGEEILDLSYLLKANYFAAPTTVDESANYEGRKMILGKIEEQIIKLWDMVKEG